MADQNITVTTDVGDDLLLRASTARGGNTYWATLALKKNGERYFSKYGVNVTDEVITELPKSVKVCGVTIPVVIDRTEKGQARAKASATVAVKGHGDKLFTLRITDLNGVFNVQASIRGISTGGGTRAQSAL